MPSAPQPGRLALFVLLTTLAFPSARAQQPPRTRLYLKDGTYQLVLDYQIVGDIVRYHSAEREGALEDIPRNMVDFTATEHWQQQHMQGSGAVLSPELAAEEEARRSLHPEVAPGLHLPDEDSVLALDSFHNAPELVPLAQYGSDLNRETAHAVQAMAIDPSSLAHRIAEITGPASGVQLHTLQPVFYLRIGSDDAGPISGGFVVDTHGAGAGRPTPAAGDARSSYVLERLDVRRDLRLLSSFRIAWLGTLRAQANITELREEPLPGGRWLRLTPALPLEPGEYALVEILSARDLNLDVWDFGIHPDAKENYEAIHPEVRKPPMLERRPE